MINFKDLLTIICLSTAIGSVNASTGAPGDAASTPAPLERKGSIQMSHEDHWGAEGPVSVRELQGFIIKAADASRLLAGTYYAPDSRQARIFTRIASDLQALVAETEATYLLRSNNDNAKQNTQGYIDQVNRVSTPGSNRANWN